MIVDYLGLANQLKQALATYSEIGSHGTLEAALRSLSKNHRVIPVARNREPSMTARAFIFECSSSTYMDCMEKSLFGSNKTWPLEIKTGDYLLLHHYEIGGLLGLWQATCNGGKNVVPKMWGGKFPFQVRVKLVIPKPTEVPPKVLADVGINAAVGRFDNCLDEELAAELVNALLSSKS